MRPSRPAPSSEARLTNRLATTSGTSTIVTRRTKSAPSGSNQAIVATSHPPPSCPANPNSAPATSATSMRTCGRKATSGQGVGGQILEHGGQRRQGAIDVGKADVAHVPDAKRAVLEGPERGGHQNPSRLQARADESRREPGRGRHGGERRGVAFELRTLARQLEIGDATS